MVTTWTHGRSATREATTPSMEPSKPPPPRLLFHSLPLSTSTSVPLHASSPSFYAATLSRACLTLRRPPPLWRHWTRLRGGAGLRDTRPLPPTTTASLLPQRNDPYSRRPAAGAVTRTATVGYGWPPPPRPAVPALCCCWAAAARGGRRCNRCGGDDTRGGGCPRRTPRGNTTPPVGVVASGRALIDGGVV